jgi:hypothetical protein
MGVLRLAWWLLIGALLQGYFSCFDLDMLNLAKSLDLV